MKMAPIIEALNEHPDKFTHILVHTGQHYDARMSQAFFDDLGMPRPDIDLGVGSGSHAEQTAHVMLKFEKVCMDYKPDLVIVVGDVNSTIACTLTAKKLGICVAHVEAGLRSRDRTMPEEMNRLCTDVLCDFLFTTDTGANENLISEGIPEDRIQFVGNVMIDSLLRHKEMASGLGLVNEMRLRPGGFATVTLHRPSNVDDRETLKNILSALEEIGQKIPVVFPVHPRTQKMIDHFELSGYLARADHDSGIIVTEPLGYLEFLHLNMNAKMILTDSGGLQEEATVLGVPCITLRFNTERPVTVQQGTNVIVGNEKFRILEAAEDVLAGKSKRGRIPDRWDGNAAIRIVDFLKSLSSSVT